MADGTTASRFSFNLTELTRLEPPARGRRHVYDTRCPGLTLCVTPAGTKTFYLYRRVQGRPQRTHLGRFPGMTVEQARKRAAVLNAEIAEGGDPQQRKRRLREEVTLGELFEHYMETHAKVHKRSWQEDERLFRQFLAPWAHRRASSVTRSMVQALHAKVGRDNGRYSANRLLALLSTVFNKTADAHAGLANPTTGITRFREESRDRFMDGEEVARFFKALAEEPNPLYRDFFVVCLLTGARRRNVQAMRWSDADLDRGIWRVSGAESKSGQPLVVVLPEPVVVLLRSRRAQVDSQYVFPARSRSGHLVEPRFAWLRILERAGLEELRIHDLRRTLGSWQAANGTSLPIIGRALGHRDPNTTSVYARLNLDPVRAAVDAAARAMLTAAANLLPEADTKPDR